MNDAETNQQELSGRSYGVVRNIPGAFHSSDLKNFFSDFVENAKFKCFHFRHRPESTRAKGFDTTNSHVAGDSKQKTSSCCCVFETSNEEALSELIAKYSMSNWIDRSGNYIKARCIIHRIKINAEGLAKKPTESFKNRGELKYKKHHAESEEFSHADLLALSELKPPVHVMPRGNVGTTTNEFMKLIRECKLPPRSRGFRITAHGSHILANIIICELRHRPESIRTKGFDTTNSHVTGDSKQKTNSCCCVFETSNEEALSELIAKYSMSNWIDRSGNYIKARCIIHRIKVNAEGLAKKPTESFKNRGEMKYQKHHAESEEFSHADLLALSELKPPVHVMPRGNVGTTTNEFMKLIRECKLPPRIIRKLDLKFPLNGSTRRYGNVRMKYHDSSSETVPGSSTFTANGDVIETKVQDLPEKETTDADEHNTQNPQDDKQESSGSDDDDDTGEEWERHEALHNDVTSQGRTKERLFEEEIELKWEKGGSGLVFYTDAQFWNEQEGDFEEQNTDDWDVDMSEYYGQRGDLDARQYLQIRKEKMRGKAVYDDSLGDLKPNKRRRQRSQSESPPRTEARGNFERHTKGVGRRLLEKGGWTEGDPLGPRQRPGAITDPIELDGQNPNTKRGLGYHGEKLRHSTCNTSERMPPPSFIPGRPKTGKLWGPRSGEPQASHSPMYPQFAFNIRDKRFVERTKKSRQRAVPGPDDGIVITTAYDSPLNVDVQDDLLRTRHPTALKHRSQPLGRSSAADRQSRLRDETGVAVDRGNVSRDHSAAASSSALHLSSVKFVRGGLLRPEPENSSD